MTHASTPVLQPPLVVILGVALEHDSGDRTRNLIACLHSLRRQTLDQTSYRLVLIEQGTRSCISDELRQLVDHYLFVYNPKPFNRSWVLNVGGLAVEHGVICTFDGDLIVPPDFLRRGLLAWQCGAVAIKPFTEVLYMDAASTAHAQRQIAAGETIECDAFEYRGDRHRGSKGGCIWIDAALYRRMGGHDERFEGWGLEDREFWHRLERHTSVVTLHGRVLHMYHERSFEQHPEAYESAVLYGALERGLLPGPRGRFGDPEHFARLEQLTSRATTLCWPTIDEAIIDEAAVVCRGDRTETRAAESLLHAWRVRGWLAGRAGHQDVAAACATAVARASHHPLAAVELAEALERQTITSAHRGVDAPDEAADVQQITQRLAQRRRRQIDAAISASLQAIRRAPRAAAPYRSLARALLTQGEASCAVVVLQEALLLDLANGAIVCELAEALSIQGNEELARRACELAARLKPERAEAHETLGRWHVRQQAWTEAIAAFQRARELRVEELTADGRGAPATAEHVAPLAPWQPQPSRGADAEQLAGLATVHRGLGEALLGLGQTEAAITELHTARGYTADSAEVDHLLAKGLERLGRRDEEAATLVSRAAGLVVRERPDAAVDALARALDLKPDSLKALFALGELHARWGRSREAIQCFDKAIAIAPEHQAFHVARGRVAFADHDIDRGWTAFASFAPRDNGPRFDQPRWEGEPLNGRTILAWADQALGDTIHCLRYLSELRARGGRIVLQCPRRLFPIARRLSGIERVVSDGAPLPAFDVHVPLMQIPVLLPSSRWPGPPSPPDFTADPHLVDVWRERLLRATESGEGDTRTAPLFVGLSWAGHPDGINREVRFTTLTSLAPLAGLPNVQFVSLQMGIQAPELVAPPPGLDIAHLQDDGCTLDDTAALMESLDAIVTVDTAVAHLAGALRRPVLMPLPLVCDWRWMPVTDYTRLYDSMRIFRQTAFGDWRGVFERIRDALEQMAAERGSAVSLPQAPRLQHASLT